MYIQHENMDPLTILSFGGSLAGNLFGLGKSAKANRQYDKYIADMNQRLENWYNKEYNTNYLDTEEAKSVLRLLFEQQKEQSEDLQNSAAITGASAEKQVAQKEKLNKNYTQAVTGMSGLGTRRKENIQNQYMGRKGQIDQLTLQNLLNKSQNWNTFGQNVSSTAQNLLLSSLLSGGGKGPLTALFHGASAGKEGQSLADVYGGNLDWLTDLLRKKAGPAYSYSDSYNP